MAAPPATIDPDIWERLRELAGDRLLIGQAGGVPRARHLEGDAGG